LVFLLRTAKRDKNDIKMSEFGILRSKTASKTAVKWDIFDLSAEVTGSGAKGAVVAAIDLRKDRVGDPSGVSTKSSKSGSGSPIRKIVKVSLIAITLMFTANDSLVECRSPCRLACGHDSSVTALAPDSFNLEK